MQKLETIFFHFNFYFRSLFVIFLIPYFIFVFWMVVELFRYQLTCQILNIQVFSLFSLKTEKGLQLIPNFLNMIIFSKKITVQI